jgi:zinc finger SWIM domain-containing protein 3
MLQHYEHCLSTLRKNEAKLDVTTSQSIPFTQLEDDSIEKDAALVFTPTVFDLVKEKIGCISKYGINEIVDGG